jgi:hypothetical protein
LKNYKLITEKGGKSNKYTGDILRWNRKGGELTPDEKER